tara:strand:- start:296 stop:1726 length:1431 start_codon:yes stop_codon:yes gene_type:complete
MLNIPTKADGVDTLSATEFNSLNNELKNIIESTGQVLAGGDLFQMAKSAAAYAGSGTFHIDSGTTNSYVLSAIDSFKAIDAYTDGLIIRFVATTENTGAATVNVNSLGAKSIVTSSGVGLPSGDIVIGDYITARYDAGNDNFLVEPAFSKVSANSGRSLIINGDFSIWQRAVSQTTSDYGSDDRWLNGNAGSTKVHSQQTFTVGQTDVPNNPIFYSRTVVTTVAGASNLVSKEYRMEGVQKTSGETLTFSFYGKADSAKDLAVEFVQVFGTGGSPSAAVVSIGVTTFSLTTSWAKHTVTVDIPSVTGKTLGTAGDDYLSFRFWFDAGSDFNARTNTLGQQNGTFDISNVQLEFGTVATDFEFISPTDQELECKRFFERLSFDSGDFLSVGYAFATTGADAMLYYSQKRSATPTFSNSGTWQVTYPGGSSAGVIGINRPTAQGQGVITISGASGLTLGDSVPISATSSATVDIDAEL